MRGEGDGGRGVDAPLSGVMRGVGVLGGAPPIDWVGVGESEGVELGWSGVEVGGS
ncbi:MAG: hypothetical protein UX78_C0022G0012 [Candidatus Amesbacteria bacterium GW2011_GWA2_47_11]|uniref:Uncharacterized protein n=1 Tax=Candidatus Amesbacteria bacterium GW2011_GWA2_47_11 TaxID=1618357 RepID=A0A0G1TME0_9BACT|nr:MAG: hypothetical protein UX78_C0022G0012 [Candidatus Amesbacteria bacterium GW2011_GWA2_47_11]